jgi:hypothetical protein
MLGELTKLLDPDAFLGVALGLGMYGSSAFAMGLQRLSGTMLPGNGCRVHELKFALHAVVAES